jgi:hypothetical protein
MAESTLSIAFEDVMRIVAERAGYGYFATTGEGLTALQATEIGIYVPQAERRVLSAHDWFWSKPTGSVVLFATITATESGSAVNTFKSAAAAFQATMIGHTIVMTTSGTIYTITAFTSTTEVTISETYSAADNGDTFTVTADGANRMPDDFGGLIGPVAYVAGQGSYPQLEKTGVAKIRRLQQESISTGRPTLCGELALVVSGTGQRFDLLTWRIADQDYTILFRFQINFDALTTGIFAYGGMQAAELWVAAALAAMELGKFHIKGPLEQDYQQKLQDAIRKDSRDHRSDTLGVLVDSEIPSLRDRFTLRNRTTYNGDLYP